MTKKERKIIEHALYNYKKFFNNVVMSTVEWAESGLAIDYSKPRITTTSGNFKENKLCGIIDTTEGKLKYCRLVEKVLEHYHFDNAKIRFIEVHFFNNKNDISTCMEVGISRRSFYNWQNEIVEFAYNWAKELKVL